MVSRRVVLGVFAASAAGAFTAVSNVPSIDWIANDVPNGKPLDDGQKAIVDLHTHPPFPRTRESLERLLDKLTQNSGATALTAITRPEVAENLRIFTFEEAMKLPRYYPEVIVVKTNPGESRLFWIRPDQPIATGLLIRSQEIVVEGGHHLVAYGFDQQYLPNFLSAKESVDMANNYGAKTIFAHPYVLPTGKYPINFGEAESELEEGIQNVARLTFELESHNGQAIDIPGVMGLKRTNERAAKLAVLIGKKGIASTDAHVSYEIQNSGILVPRENLGVASINDAINTKTFERVANYSSMITVVNGRFFSG